MADVNIACRSCRKRVLMDVMRYDPDDRKKLICPECFNHKIREKDKNSKTRRILMSMQKPVKKSNFVKHKCYNCGYEFMRKTISKQKNCPYCGHKDVYFEQKPGMDWTRGL